MTEEERRERHREKKNARQRRRYAEDPEFRARKIARTRANYRRAVTSRRAQARGKPKGLSADEVIALEKAHDGKCAICGTDAPGGRFGVFHIDHCHTTGRIRGFLCHNCNVGIGHMEDNPARLRAAAVYLEAANDA